MGLTAAEQDLLANTANVGAPQDEQYSQASQRYFRIFTDQWGREWGADCELKTHHPCGPWSARFRAPLMPPKKYMLIVDTMRAKVLIDTRRWIDDLLEADTAFWQEVHRWASEKAGIGALKLYDRSRRWVDDQLLPFTGNPPMSIEVIQAMRAGNPWLLGLRKPDGSEYPKPAAAPRDIFPDAEQLEATSPYKDSDPWAGGEAEDPPEPPETNDAEPTGYPYMYGPGYWWLSAGHRADFLAGKRKGFRGSKLEAERAMEKGEIPPLEDEVQVDPSWEE